MMLPSNSNPKRQNIEEVDIISNLPDSVLSHILSFMPTTRQVVATSILAKQWRYLWTFVDRIVFEFWPPVKRRFAPFVNKVLKLHQGNIKDLTLYCFSEGCNELDLTTWINTVISRGVEKLDVQNQFFYKYPLSLFTSKTLVDLKISFSHLEIINTNAPLEHFFPCLKKLHVRTLGCDSVSIQQIISHCSALERLIVYSRTSPFDIVSSSLKRLELHMAYRCHWDEKFVLGVPSLEYLMICCILPIDLVLVEKMSSLVEADIKFPDTFREFRQNVKAKQLCDSFVRFIQPLYNVKVLRIECNLVTFVNFVGHDQFRNLTKLEVVSQFFEWRLLATLMEGSINLEEITLKKTCNSKRCKLGWKEPKYVLPCLTSSLRKFSLDGFSEDELTMVKYVLRTSQNLEWMEILCPNYYKEVCKSKML